MGRRSKDDVEINDNADDTDDIIETPELPQSNFRELDEKELATVGTRFEDKLASWIERNDLAENENRVYLYKYVSPTSDVRAACGRWENEIPDEHTIGMTYGSGKYLLSISVAIPNSKKRRSAGYYIHIHSSYDEQRKLAAQNGINPATGQFNSMAMVPAIRQENPNNQIQQSMNIVRDIMGMFLPIIQQNMVSAKPAIDPNQLLASQYNLVQGMMKRNVIDTQNIINDMRRAQINGESMGTTNVAEVEMIEEKEPSLLDTVSQLAEKFLPLLLSKGPQSNITAAAIKTAPQFAKIMQDKTEVKKLIEYFDSKQGKDKTNIVLKKLGVTRPI